MKTVNVNESSENTEKILTNGAKTLIIGNGENPPVYVDVKGLYYDAVNEGIRELSETNIYLENVNGQRYIGAGSSGRQIVIDGVPGNAVGAYLNGSRLVCLENVQEAAGDTMNGGEIVIFGSAGDACGYAMRGGEIYVRGNAGYRAGIHMKAYEDRQPSIVIGGSAGDFLGEYQAGGKIVVLGLFGEECPVSGFCATGMHGGKMYIRSAKAPQINSKQVLVQKATAEDLEEIETEISKYCEYFDIKKEDIYNKDFYVLVPDTKNPYKQMYTNN